MLCVIAEHKIKLSGTLLLSWRGGDGKAEFLTMLFSAVICLFYGLNRAVLEGQGSGVFPGNFGIDPQLL